MNLQELRNHPHRRFNPLAEQWVLVSPQRSDRPWQGQVEPVPAEPEATFDPNCYLCPGNSRAGGVRNPQYQSTFAFDNDFAALNMDGPRFTLQEQDLLRAQSEYGRCRVLCFSPQHNLTISRMGVAQLREVVDAWIREFRQLVDEPNISAVQIFENRGALMGCSNPHPHGQIWANETVPNELAQELKSFRNYYSQHGSTLLHDYVVIETAQQERVVCENEYFVVLVPFWAVWPFETLLVSRRAISSLLDLTDAERTALAEILRQITIRYDNLFSVPFPYSMGFHQRPTDSATYSEFHLHAHFYPPLLRSATVKKFMVGYEMLAMPQRDLSPESAAEWLRSLPAQHYLTRT